MYKLYLMLDEWDNDKNFVGRELEELMKNYEVTLICNSASKPAMVNGDFAVYKKPGKPAILINIIKGLFDRDIIREIRKATVCKGGRLKRISEVLHFYANARIFRSFMEDKGYLEDGVIYYSYWYFWKCYAITGIIDRYPSSRIITRAHGYDLYDDVRPSGYQPFKEAMDEKLDRVVFISEHGRDYYLDRYGVEDKTKYVLSCLGTKDHGVYDQYTRSDRLNIVSCSHINSVKRVHLIVQALALINDIKVNWMHYGDGDRAGEVKRLAEELLKPKDNIEYTFAGHVDNICIHEYYSQNPVDAFISASQSEGNPVSVMEAMSYGIPVIAPAVCNLPNMIGEGGMLTSDKCRVFDLAELIKRLMTMPEQELLDMRKAARNRWEEKFNEETNSRVFVDEVLGGL